MGCNNCGDKKSLRHNPAVSVKGDVDATVELETRQPRTGKSFEPDPDMPQASSAPPSPDQAWKQALELSFEEILRRQDYLKQRAALEVEAKYREMTDAMRQYHVISLLAVANYENISMPGVSPEQAVIGLKESLDREDFSNINDLYPTLKEKVAVRYQELMSKRIVL